LDKVEQLNQTLREHAPAAWACLSRSGRAAVTLVGIPAQSAEAKECTHKATMGQVTDGADNPVPLPALARSFAGMDPRSVFLYSAQGGVLALRQAWSERQARAGGGAPRTLPLVTQGLTHGVSLAAELFCDEGTEVLWPFPSWGNYTNIFCQRRGAVPRHWSFFDDTRRFNVEGFLAGLRALEGPAVVVLNFPGNPGGYAPTLAEWARIRDALLGHPGPLVVVCDDAYGGMVWEEGLLANSPFYELARRADPARLLPMKVDGATKELGFFGGRVGFATFGLDGPAGAALEDKALAVVRGTVSCLSGPGQTAVLSALNDPDLPRQEAAFRELLLRRYRALREALVQLEGTALEPYPFNAGFFALVGVTEGDADALRRRLIVEQSVGLVSVAGVNALRIAYGAIAAQDIAELMRRVRIAATG